MASSKKLEPLFASEASAAALLDMKVAEFRTLVTSGALPSAVRFNRWDVSSIVTIMRGEASRPQEGFDL
jgi:hypothetical protein